MKPSKETWKCDWNDKKDCPSIFRRDKDYIVETASKRYWTKGDWIENLIKDDNRLNGVCDKLEYIGDSLESQIDYTSHLKDIAEAVESLNKKQKL